MMSNKLYSEFVELYNMLKVGQNELQQLDKDLNNTYKIMYEAHDLLNQLQIIHNKRVTNKIIYDIMSNTKQNKKINKYVQSFEDVEQIIDDYLLSFD
jgi:flagellar biosynthesis/type III secretory pathway chaperone